MEKQSENGPTKPQSTLARAVRAGIFLSNTSMKTTAYDTSYGQMSIFAKKIMLLNERSAIHGLTILHTCQPLDRVQKMAASLSHNTRIQQLTFELNSTEIKPYAEILPKLAACSLAELRFSSYLSGTEGSLGCLTEVLENNSINLTELELIASEDTAVCKLLGKFLVSASRNETLKKLTLGGANLSLIRDEFAGFLRDHKCSLLHTLSFRDVSCHRLEQKLFSEAFTHTPKVKSLTIENHRSSKSEYLSLVGCLGLNTTVTQLNLTGTSNQAEEADALFKHLAGNSSLEELKLERCSLLPSKHFTAIVGLKKLRTLVIDGTPISIESLVILLTGLHSQLETLNLSRVLQDPPRSYLPGPHTDSDSRRQNVLALCNKASELLGKSEGLRCLELGFNILRDADVEALAEGLRHNHSLLFLDLKGNELRGENLTELLAAAKHHPTLKSLILDNNSITGAGGSKIVNGLAGSASLKNLSMLLNLYGIEKTKDLSEKLAVPFTVNVTRNYIGARRRLAKEMKDLTVDRPDCIEHMEFGDENSLEWICWLKGPAGTPYEGGIFKLSIQFSTEYPFKPPRVTFQTRIYHANVTDRGGLPLDILHDNWSPALTIQKLMLTIAAFLGDVDGECVYNSEMRELFVHNRAEYDKKAREFTDKYAKQE